MVMRRSLLLLCLTGALCAAEVEATPAPPKPEPGKPVSIVPDEEKWVFEPQAGRADPFYDVEIKLRLETEQANMTTRPLVGPATSIDSQDKVDEAIEWGAKEIERIDLLSMAHKWNDVIHACENAVKVLKRYEANGPVTDLIERFNQYRTQAEEAKIYEEAQAKFDALGLKVEGILWSQEGSLAIISGEQRALKINDRAKDCQIINIDQNRVDFLFVYNRRRFEFQRYVRDPVNAASKAR
jgi:hypothetical protein